MRRVGRGKVRGRSGPEEAGVEALKSAEETGLELEGGGEEGERKEKG